MQLAGGLAQRPPPFSASVCPSSTPLPSFGSMTTAVRNVSFSKTTDPNNGDNTAAATGAIAATDGSSSTLPVKIINQPAVTSSSSPNRDARSEILGFPCETIPNQRSMDGNQKKGNQRYGNSDEDPPADLLAGAHQILGFPKSSLVDDESPPTIAQLAAQINALQGKLAAATGTTEPRHGRRRSLSRGRRSQSRGRQPPMGKSWSQIVQKEGVEAPGNPAKQMALQYFPPQRTDDRVLVQPPTEVAEEGKLRWQCTLVGYFIEGKPSFTVVRDQTMKLWGAKGLTNVMANERGFFFFMFSSATACSEVLEAGPWIIQRQPLFLQPWRPGMKLYREAHDTVPLWIKLFNVPFEFWTEKGFGYLGSAVGVPLFPDAMTASGRCVNYMRLCVEVSTTHPLTQTFDLMLPPAVDGADTSVTICVEYPWKPKVCHHCKVFGHMESNCFRKKKEQRAAHEANVATESIVVPLATVISPTCDVNVSQQAVASSTMPQRDVVDISALDQLRASSSKPILEENSREEPEELAVHRKQTEKAVEIRMGKSVLESPNKFACLGDGNDDTLLDSPLGPLAGKIQHIDGGEASAKKKKGRGRGGGSSTSSHSGLGAQLHKRN